MLNHNKTNSGHKKTTKYEIHVEQMSETKLKAQELEEKQYTKEQHIDWANLIKLG